ncbi:MAG: helix-turn-helix domain-containing protein [Candidatus Levyibacteriota bacterium]|nr:MAG: helix-turn-helix domain-containing protein [Candidatus Levybacteria bacterium]
MIRVGQKLKEARLKKGLTVADAAKATKIKALFLEALEKGDYTKLPSVAYAQGFVRNYAIFLGIPTQALLAIFRREFDEKKMYKVLPEGFVETSDFSTKRLPVRTILVGLLLFVGLFGYIFFQYKYAVINPPLVILQPKENQVVETADVVVLGKTDVNVSLSINSVPVSLDENGQFKKTINVFPGKETIIVKAVSRFGTETIVERHIEIKSK